MTRKPLENDTFRVGLKIKGRTRRQAARKLANTGDAARVARNDLLPILVIEQVPIAGLKSHTRRLRKSDAAHVREIANSIAAFGFNVPLLIGKSDVLVDGESRLEAAKLLCLLSAPCIRVDHLDDNEQRLLRLAVNRIAEKGSWDIGELQAEFQELIILDAPIELSGFGSDEIDQLVIGDAVDLFEVGQLAPNPGANATSRLGDMFQLGKHRLICGDATDPRVLSRLMGGDPLARLVLTDEPYNVKIAGHVTSGVHREFVMGAGELSAGEFAAFNEAWITATLAHLCDGGLLATFIDWRGYPTVHAAATKLSLTPINLVIWAKTNAGMGSLYRSQHELLPLFKKGVTAHVNNVALGKKGRWRSNVWTYPGASSLGSDARRGLQEHPTVKPTALLEDALLDLTHRGEIVLDPFLGSGSMLIAADNTARVCRGLELDPLYVDVIVRRYEAHSGQNAVLIETGETFEVLARRRALCVDTPVIAGGEIDSEGRLKDLS